MTKTPNSNNTGVPSDSMANYMLIELSYSCKLLLPIEEGNLFLSAYSKGREWKEDYQKPVRLSASPPQITIRYLTEAQLAQIKFDDMLGLSNND